MPQWVAERYDALPLPHEEWGRRVVAGLELDGDETVLDVGCGTGRDLALVLDRLPRGRAVGVDQSESMVARVRERFAQDPRVDVLCEDMGAALPLPSGTADAVMSVAAMHWVLDHRPVWSELARVLRPGGQLRVECGGAGNIVRVVDAVRAVCGPDAVPNWNFATAEETAELLRQAGFVEVRTALRTTPAVFSDDETFHRYLRTLVLHDLDATVLDEVAERLGDRTIDYVRLEVSAQRASDPSHTGTPGSGTTSP
jgi:trans-aconitate 2-methyltransferase